MTDPDEGKGVARRRGSQERTLKSEVPPALSDDTQARPIAEGAVAQRSRHQLPESTPLLSPGTRLCQGRFEVHRSLGAGGMGVVYEAVDHGRQGLVALKMLARTGPEEIYRLKKEFRLLSGIRHPNLAVLYDLFADEDRWFFTMELVDGRPFDEWWISERPGLDALRSVFRQLGLGIQALHRANRLHCDIKPTNVLVTTDCRPIILDFGIALELSSVDAYRTGPEGFFQGTPAYMAPEQIGLGELVPESDWYAFGVMLFQALTHEMPFSERNVLAQKLQGAAPKVRERTPEAPKDLADLADALLKRDPGQRPLAEEILEVLESAPTEVSRPVPAGPEPFTFLGRDAELDELRGCFGPAARSRPCVCLVRGKSGMGKTALIETFLKESASRGGAVVLRGRCSDRESVPYKAFDGLVDDLSRYLCRLPKDRASQLVPRDAFAAAQLFPVLERVDVIAEAPRRAIPDPNERRRRGVVALAELFSRIADRGPLVLFIDDLQWTDNDSALLLRDLIEQPDPPSLLVIGSFRTEHAAENPALSQLWEMIVKSNTIAHRQITLEPLPLATCERLAETICGREASIVLERIAQESGGSPLFVRELSLFWSTDTTFSEKLPSLDVLLHQRIARLSTEARELLEAIALSALPLNTDFLNRLWKSSTPLSASIDLLVDQQLVRAVSLSLGDVLECYHDKIRECVVSAMSATSAERTHRLLAEVGELAPKPDADSLALHWDRAGDVGRAVVFAAQAAHNAMTQLAFEQAAARASYCIESGELDTADRRKLLILRGDAISALGKGFEASECYLLALDGADRDLGIELRRRAAQHLLLAGHMSRGTQLLEEVLVELDLPKEAGSVVWQRIATRVRGTRFTQRSEATIPAVELSRVDASWTSALCFSLTDNIRGASYQALHLRQALGVGEPFRVARALILEYGYQGRLGLGRASHAESLRSQVFALIQELQHPRLLGMLKAGDAIAQFCQGRLQAAVESADEAVQLLEGELEDAYYFQTVALFFRSHALFMLGRYNEIRHSLERLLEMAQRQGNLFMEVTLGAGWARAGAQLSQGRVDEHRAMSDVHRQSWVKQPFLMQHALMLVGDALEGNFLRNTESVYRELRDRWDDYLRSELRTIAAVQAAMLFARGSTAASCLCHAADLRLRRRALADVRFCVRNLRKVERDFPSVAPVRWLLVAAEKCSIDDRAGALVALGRAREVASEQSLRGFEAAAQYRLGQLLGGDEGRALIARAESFYRFEGVTEMERTTEMLAPGCAPAVARER